MENSQSFVPYYTKTPSKKAGVCSFSKPEVRVQALIRVTDNLRRDGPGPDSAASNTTALCLDALAPKHRPVTSSPRHLARFFNKHVLKGEVECSEPLDVLSHKLGLQKVSSSGKESKTTFERISFNGTSSVIRCRPHTGRTHQIRVHLQYLGYPIVNDPMYNSDIWGPLRGKGGNYGNSEEEVIRLMMNDHNKMKYVNAEAGSVSEIDNTDSASSKGSHDESKDKSGEDVTNASLSASRDLESRSDSHTKDTCSGAPSGDKVESTGGAAADSVTSDASKLATEQDGPHQNIQTTSQTDTNKCGFDPAKMTFDPTCLDCKRQFKDPSPEELVMYLHALKYKGPDWEFETPLPPWAAEDWHDR